jgi:hypothetical protein
VFQKIASLLSVRRDNRNNNQNSASNLAMIKKSLSALGGTIPLLQGNDVVTQCACEVAIAGRRCDGLARPVAVPVDLRSKNVGRKIISQSRVLKFFAPHFSTNSFCTFVGTRRHPRAKQLVRVGACQLRFDFLSKAIRYHSFMTSFCLPGCLRPVRSYGPKNQGSAATVCSVTFLPALFR